MWVFLAPGAGMIVVAVASVILWRRLSYARWRWFAVGAGVWFVAVAIKIVWSVSLDRAVIGALEAHVPARAYHVLGGLYVGVQSSICEIGLTLAAALIWRQMTRAPGRGIAVGVGAGAFEALLLGVTAVAGIIAVVHSHVGGEKALEQLERLARVTPLLWLVAPVERILAILCHTSSRALVLLAVAKKRPLLFWWGFLLFAGLDAVAGYAHVAEHVGKISTWWIELAILPFALVSIPIICWCTRKWPKEEATRASEQSAFQGERTTPSAGVEGETK